MIYYNEGITEKSRSKLTFKPSGAMVGSSNNNFDQKHSYKHTFIAGNILYTYYRPIAIYVQITVPFVNKYLSIFRVCGLQICSYGDIIA